jgi:DNA-binding NarL/FixJ family response regulator
MMKSMPFKKERPMARTRVLVADGHREIRRVVREFFEAQGGYLVVGEASNGIQAVDEVDRLRPDLVLLDLELPLRNGLEATRMIKQRHAHTRVIVSTLFDDPLYRAKAREVNVDGIVVKSSLKHSLESIFGNAQRRRDSWVP